MKALTQAQIYLVLFLLVGIGILSTQTNLFQISGFSTLSLQKVDFVSNDPTLQRSAWLLTVSVNGQGQKAVGTFSKSQLVDTQDGVRATNDLTISISVDKHEARYPIQATNKLFYKLQYEKRTYWFGIGAQDFERECKSNPNFYRFAKKGMTWDYYCITKTKEAVYGIILDPTVSFETTVTLQSGTKTQTAKISNTGQKSAWIGDVAYVTWQGNLVSGEMPPSPGTYQIAAAYAGNFVKSWRIIDNLLAQQYFSYHTSGFDSCVKATNGDIEQCVAKYNNMVNTVLAGKSFYYNGVYAKTYGDVNNGQVILELTKLLQFPVLTLHIDAEWIGIQIPVGRPQIISASSSEFTVGSTGYIVLRVKNVGDAEASFGVQVSLPQGFSMQGYAPTISLKPNEEKTIQIPVLASSTTDITGYATVKVYDINNPTIYDTARVKLTAKKLLLCADGEKRVNGNIIEICVNGNKWEIYKKCADDETAVIDRGEAKCVKKDQYKPGIFESIGSWLSNILSGPIEFIKTLLIVVGIIFLVLIALQFRGVKFK